MGNKILFILILFILFFEVTGYNPQNIPKDMTKGVLNTPTGVKKPSIIDNILPSTLLNDAMKNINKFMPQLKSEIPEISAVMPQINANMPEIGAIMPQINGVLPGVSQSFKTASNYASMAPSLLILVFALLIFRRVIAIITYFSRR